MRLNELLNITSSRLYCKCKMHDFVLLNLHCAAHGNTQCFEYFIQFQFDNKDKQSPTCGCKSNQDCLDVHPEKSEHVSCVLFVQLNSDSATDDMTSNHVDSLQQTQESSFSVMTEEGAILPTLPSLASLPRLDSPSLEMAHSDSTSSQLPEVRSIGRSNNLWCSGAF